MPCEYRTYPRHNVIVKRYVGRVTTRCVLDLLDQVECDESYAEGMKELDDLRDVVDFDIPESDIARFADLIKGVNNRRRQPSTKAVVADSVVIRQAAELYSAEVKDMPEIKIGVFSAFDDALLFLGLQDQALGKRLLSGELPDP